MARYQAVPGTCVEDLGEVWAAYSPASGETHLINNESAVLIEWLQASGPADSRQAALALSDDVGVAPEVLTQTIDVCWIALLVAGLVRRVDDHGYSPAS